MEPRRNLAVIQQASAPAPMDEMAVWQLIERQADVLVKSGMLPPSVKTPAAAVAIMVLGRELGFERMQSFRLIDVINGKPTLNSGGMAAIVQDYCTRHGGYLRVVESTDQRAVVEFKRAEWPEPHRFTFSIDDARRAELLGKSTWKQYPQNMLYARAVANACRMGFPDVVAARIYAPAELTPATAPTPIASIADLAPVERGDRSAPDEADDQNVIDAVAEPVNDSKAMRRLHAVGNDRDLNHEELRRVAQLRHKGLTSLTELDEAALNALASEIETASEDELALWTTNWEERIARAVSQSDLDVIAEELARGGISRATRPDLTRAWKERKTALQSGELPGMPIDADRYTA